MYMGLINIIEFRSDEALRLYKKSLIDTPALRERRAFVYYRQNKYEEAINAISDLEEEENASPEIMEKKAECQKAMKFPLERISQSLRKAAYLYYKRSF